MVKMSKSLLGLVVLFLVVFIGLIIIANQHGSPNKTTNIDWGEKAIDIARNDSNVTSLFGNNFMVVGGIIDNESIDDLFVSNNNTTYHVVVSYNDSRVLSISEEHNQTLLDLFNHAKPTVVRMGNSTHN